MKFFMIAIGAVLILLGTSLMNISFFVGLLIAITGGLIFGFSGLQFVKPKTTGANSSNPVPDTAGFSATKPIAAEQAKVIHHPKLGFLNLLGESATTTLLQDLDNLEDIFFQNVDLGKQQIPTCNILFIYCVIEPTGRIAKQKFSLREVVKSAGAQIVIVAAENRLEVISSPLFKQYLKVSNDWPVNFIFTVNRNGEAFGLFFQKLFNKMLSGVPMQDAWTQLAPQSPEAQKECPGTIALFEAGHITLRPI